VDEDPALHLPPGDCECSGQDVVRQVGRVIGVRAEVEDLVPAVVEQDFDLFLQSAAGMVARHRDAHLVAFFFLTSPLGMTPTFVAPENRGDRTTFAPSMVGGFQVRTNAYLERGSWDNCSRQCSTALMGAVIVKG